MTDTLAIQLSSADLAALQKLADKAGLATADDLVSGAIAKLLSSQPAKPKKTSVASEPPAASVPPAPAPVSPPAPAASVAPPAVTASPKPNPQAFADAKVRAEGLRQSALSAALAAFEADIGPDRQRTYDLAIKAAEHSYFSSCVAAARQFGIEPQSYRRGLDRVS